MTPHVTTCLHTSPHVTTSHHTLRFLPNSGRSLPKSAPNPGQIVDQWGWGQWGGGVRMGMSPPPPPIPFWVRSPLFWVLLPSSVRIPSPLSSPVPLSLGTSLPFQIHFPFYFRGGDAHLPIFWLIPQFLPPPSHSPPLYSCLTSSPPPTPHLLADPNPTIPGGRWHPGHPISGAVAGGLRDPRVSHPARGPPSHPNAHP